MSLTRDELEKESKTTIEEIEESKGLLANKKELYFPEELESQIRARFELFDRDGDGLLVFFELQVPKITIFSVYCYRFLLTPFTISGLSLLCCTHRVI